MFHKRDEMKNTECVEPQEERSFQVGKLDVVVSGKLVKIFDVDSPETFVEVNNDVYDFIKVFNGIQCSGFDSHLSEVTGDEEKLLMAKAFNGIFFSLITNIGIYVLKYVHRADDYVLENGNELVVELMDFGGPKLTVEFIPGSGNLFVSLDGFGNKTFDSIVSTEDVMKWIEDGLRHVSKE